MAGVLSPPSSDEKKSEGKEITREQIIFALRWYDGFMDRMASSLRLNLPFAVCGDDLEVLLIIRQLVISMQEEKKKE